MLQRLRFSIVDFKKLKSTACPLISSQPQQRSQSRSIELLRQRLRGSELFRVLDRNAIRFHLAYTSRFVLTRILLSRLAVFESSAILRRFPTYPGYSQPGAFPSPSIAELAGFWASTNRKVAAKKHKPTKSARATTIRNGNWKANGMIEYFQE